MKRLKSLRASIVVPALVIVLAATACADVTTTAIGVNGETMDRDEVMDQLTLIEEEVKANPSLPEEFDTPVGTLRSDATATILDNVIKNMGLRQAVEAEGIEVTQSQITDMLASSQASGSFTFDLVLAEINALAVAGSTAGINLAEVFAAMDVDVDPRFGVWSPELGRLISSAEAEELARVS